MGPNARPRHYEPKGHSNIDRIIHLRGSLRFRISHQLILTRLLGFYRFDGLRFGATMSIVEVFNNGTQYGHSQFQRPR
jgi:hypothetical protein